MAQFLERNKKKGLLALLLLFLRRRKASSLLLLLVLLASTLIVTPSYLLIDLPGGARLAAGVAWVAHKAGVDTAAWGLGGKSSFRDLMTAFRAAKAAGAARSVGWGAFMGRAPQGAPVSSIDMIKGDRKELESIVVRGPAQASSVKGVLTPEDAKAAGEGVAISEDDLGGERQSFLGGLMKGLSGGAFAGKGFFSGGASAGSRADDRAQEGLDSVGAVAVPKSHIAGTAGRISARRAQAANARVLRGGRRARALGNHLALTQLAEGKGRASLAEDCIPPACPHEYAAVQVAAVFDGNPIGGRFLAGPRDAAPSVPSDAGAEDAGDIAECGKKALECQNTKKPHMKRMGELSKQVTDLAAQMGGACDDKCDCGGCNSIKDQIHSICDGELKTVITKIDAPCAIPAKCAAMNFQDPTTGATGPIKDICAMDMGSCGCDDFFCDVGCFLGLGGS